ncbi:TolC family protein [Hydrogenimonas sp.]
MKRPIVQVLLSVAAMSMLGGCAYEAAGFREATASLKSETVGIRDAFVADRVEGNVSNGWLESFDDPTLISLVAEAQKNNPDLRVTATRVEKAVALMRLGRSGLYPHFNLLGSFNDFDGAKRDRGYLVGSIAWEPDIWGRLTTLDRADEEVMKSVAADFAWARQSLAAMTAKAWFALNRDKMLHDFMREIVRIQEKALHVAKEREEIGAGTRRDVHLVTAMTAESKQMLKNFETMQQVDTRSLETLVGRYPANAIEPKGLTKMPSRLPASGIPADLLNRRPDLVAARHRVAAAFHDEKAAELLKLPNITLRFDMGYDHVYDTLAQLIGNLFMPVYDAGRIDALIAAATADQKAAIANYRSVVLRAFREVENALAQEKQLKARYDLLTTTEREYKTAYDMTVETYEIGEGTLIDVLTAQSKWIDAGITRVDVANQRLANRIDLYLALGGGFDAKPSWNPSYGKEASKRR